MADIPYATDEDIAIRASSDFALLCPRDQKLAAGTDGLFDASDRWTLRSAAVDFSAQGVMPGHVVQLLGPIAEFRPPGEALVAQEVAGHAVTLRRKGHGAGEGQPPAPEGDMVGVEFLVATLSPQIERASDDLDHLAGISERPGGRLDLADADIGQLRELVVLSVLRRQYLDMSREAGGSKQDALAAKAQWIAEEFDDSLARAAIHRRTAGGDEAMTRFSTRIAR